MCCGSVHLLPQTKSAVSGALQQVRRVPFTGVKFESGIIAKIAAVRHAFDAGKLPVSHLIFYSES